MRAFASLVEMLTPVLAGHGRRVGAVSREIAQELGLPEKEANEIEIAGLLHDIGKLGFPEKLLAYRQKTWTDQDKARFQKHPEQGEAAVQFIDKLDHVGMLIRHHHEQYDGHGYPDSLADEQIPMGSRIIAAADAYDRIVKLKVVDDDTLKKASEGNPVTHKNLSEEVLQKAAMLHLRDQAFVLYDPDVVKKFLDMLKTEGIRYGREKELSLEQLESGMVLSESIHTSSGRFLLSKNTTLTNDFIAKLKSIHFIEPITELIRVERT